MRVQSIDFAPDYFRNTIHQVGVDFPTPIPADLIHKLLSVAGRTAWVWREHDVALVSKDLRVPTIAPTVIPGALWSAVNQDNERIFLAWIKIGRLQQEPMNLGPSPPVHSISSASGRFARDI